MHTGSVLQHYKDVENVKGKGNTLLQQSKVPTQFRVAMLNSRQMTPPHCNKTETCICTYQQEHRKVNAVQRCNLRVFLFHLPRRDTVATPSPTTVAATKNTEHVRVWEMGRKKKGGGRRQTRIMYQYVTYSRREGISLLHLSMARANRCTSIQYPFENLIRANRFRGR